MNNQLLTTAISREGAASYFEQKYCCTQNILFSLLSKVKLLDNQTKLDVFELRTRLATIERMYNKYLDLLIEYKGYAESYDKIKYNDYLSDMYYTQVAKIRSYLFEHEKNKLALPLPQ